MSKSTLYGVQTVFRNKARFSRCSEKKTYAGTVRVHLGTLGTGSDRHRVTTRGSEKSQPDRVLENMIQKNILFSLDLFLVTSSAFL